MYGSHYSGAYQNTSGPPQPEWRPAHQPTASAQLPPPPPRPMPQAPPAVSSTYNPNIYGPMPSSQSPVYAPPLPTTSPVPGTNGDTTSWGVRYTNQHQGQSHGPPLPPREAHYSTPPPHFSPVTSAGASWANPSQPPAFLPAQQWGSDISHDQPPSGSQAPVPPPRPPLPPAYQQEISQNAQTWQPTPPPQHIGAIQYSSHPPTHNYDPAMHPQTQNSPFQYGAGNHMNHSPRRTTPFEQTRPTSSRPDQPLPGFLPPASEHLATQSIPNPPPQGVSHLPATTPGQQDSRPLANGASALGFGDPSDWEYLSSVPGEVDDTELYQSKIPESHLATSTADLTSTQGSIVQAADNITQSPMQRQSSIGSPTSPRVARPQPLREERWSPSPAGSALSQQQTAVRPAQPLRDDSIRSDYSAVSAEDPTETIDGVIQAWKHPISPMVRAQSAATEQSPLSIPKHSTSPSAVVQSPSQSNAPGNIENMPSMKLEALHSSNQPGQVSDGVKAEINVPLAKAIDPYEDLDPWFKSSLVRYVMMLRKEAVAESDEERYKIFTGFVAKETKLREILYNIDSGQEEDSQSTVDATSDKGKARVPSKSTDIDFSVDSGLIPVEAEDQSPSKADLDATTQVKENSSEKQVESDGIAYSPGGRPILSGASTSQNLGNKQGLQRAASNPTGRSQQVDTGASSTRLQSNTITGDAAGPARSTSVPPPSMTNTPVTQPMMPLISEPPRPAYTPFRYSEGPQRGSEDLNIDRPAYQAYSALRQASADSGRAMSSVPATQSSLEVDTIDKSTDAGQVDETFLGVIRAKSVSYHGNRPTPQSSPDLEELAALIPDPFPSPGDSPEVIAIKKEVDNFPDDFRYVQAATDSWEQSAQQRRTQLDNDRLARQEASEARIDGLFNDKEIGYADINPLEEDFRQTEARTQLEEERKELSLFIRQVFNPLDTRLKEEIVELKALDQRAIAELISASSDKTGNNKRVRYHLSHTMKMVNIVAAKLEARFQKRLDIALDRERRRKKAERRPLIFLGDSRALKKLDGDFEKMERQNIVEAAKDRDERANKLTDLFDEAILYGLGGHQTLLDDVATKSKKLDFNMVQRSSLPDPDKELVLRSVSALGKLLVEDAESMLNSFQVADSQLNDADYSVSVAEARYANAGSEVLLRLDAEKTKEDVKIREDHARKLKSIREGPSQITSKIDTILQSMGKEPGPGPGPWMRPAGIPPTVETPPVVPPSSSSPLPSVEEEPEEYTGEALRPGPRPGSTLPVPGGPLLPGSDTEQKERLRKALEDAKKRNAAKNFTT